MSIDDPGARPDGWGVAGDHERRVRALEAAAAAGGTPDSTENVGLVIGVNSVDPVTGAEPVDYVLTTDGAGGSVWAPAAIGAVQPFSTAIATLAATRDLRGYWRLGDGATPFADTSGNAGGPNNMVKTVIGTAMTDSVTGALPTADDDGAVQFNALGATTGDYLTATHVTLFRGSGDTTIALWVYPMSATGTQTIFGTMDVANGGWYFALSGLQMFFTRKDGGGTKTAVGPNLPLNKWTFVAVSWNPGAGVEFYLGGHLVYSDTVVQGVFDQTALRLGRRYTVPESFQGAVDEVSIWGVRLTAVEIATLATSGGLALSDGFTTSVVSTSGSYAATSHDDVILASGTSTITLPTADGITGKQITIKNIGAGTITVAQTGAETIDGSATDLTLAAADSVILVSDGGTTGSAAGWQIVGSYP